MSDSLEGRPAFHLLDALVEPEIARLRALVASHPVHRLALEAGLVAARRGADRTVLFGRAGTGLALGIGSGGIAIRTVIGTLATDELLAVADIARAAELHLDDAQADFLTPTLRARMRHRRELRYFRLAGPPRRPADARCRRLGPDDFGDVERFFRAHGASTIPERSMFDAPWLGLFEAGDLVACGGTVALAPGAAKIGNFLTHPDRRGQGLAQAVAASLAALLAAGGHVVLALGADPAACRVFEAVGFEGFETRTQLDLSPAR